MADYEKRPPELSREVALLQERALEEVPRGGPPVIPATYIRLQAGVATYVEWREKALCGGLAWLTPDSSATEQSQQERWTNGFNQAGNDAFRMLHDQVSRDDDPIEFTFELLAMQESASYAVIAGMPLAGFTGRVREHLRDFEKFRKDLDDRWKEIIDLSYSADTSRFMSDWERSRRLIMGEVYDARVERVQKTTRVLERSAENGLPNVDQVVAWVDHYGLFDGEYRAFQNVNVRREWTLQRLDEGPWRITSIQSL